MQQKKRVKNFSHNFIRNMIKKYPLLNNFLQIVKLTKKIHKFSPQENWWIMNSKKTIYSWTDKKSIPTFFAIATIPLPKIKKILPAAPFMLFTRHHFRDYYALQYKY